MPSKIQVDENLLFLFICLQKSDYKTIDFSAVGQATNLKSPAARMRYTRLKRQLGGGTLAGTQATPLVGAAKRISAEPTSRSREVQAEEAKSESPATSGKLNPQDPKAKSESADFSDGSEIDFIESDYSEDDMPLAKRRSDKIRPLDITSESSPMATTQVDVSHRCYDEGNNYYLEPQKGLKSLRYN